MPTSTLSGEAERPQVAGAVIEAHNHMHIKRMTDTVGAVLAEHNQRAPAAAECSAPAQDLIFQ